LNLSSLEVEHVILNGGSTANDDSACKKLKSEEESMRDVKMKTLGSSNMWIADWGITCHVTNSLEGLYRLGASQIYVSYPAVASTEYRTDNQP